MKAFSLEVKQYSFSHFNALQQGGKEVLRKKRFFLFIILKISSKLPDRFSTKAWRLSEQHLCFKILVKGSCDVPSMHKGKETGQIFMINQIFKILLKHLHHCGTKILFILNITSRLSTRLFTSTN